MAVLVDLGIGGCDVEIEVYFIGNLMKNYRFLHYDHNDMCHVVVYMT
jgi:hypothetical protein